MRKKVTALLIGMFFLSGTLLYAQHNGDVWGRDFADGLFIRGMYDSAIAEYQRLLDGELSADDRKEIEFRVAEASFKKKDFSQATAQFTAYRDTYDDATRARADLYLAFICVEQGNGSDAYAAFGAVDKKDLTDDQRAMYHYYFGLTAQGEAKYDEAVTLFQNVVDTDSVQLRALALKEVASCYQRSNDVDAANQALEQLINDYPDRNGIGEIYLSLGRNLFESGNFSESLSYFERAEEKGVHEESLPLLEYGILKNLFQLNRMDDVVAQVSTMNVDLFDPAIWTEVQYLYASALFQKKQFAEAGEVIDGIVQAASSDMPVGEHIVMQGVWVAYEMKADSQMDAYLKMLETQYPESLSRAEGYFLRAERLFESKSYREAVDAYARIDEYNPVFRYRDYAEYKRGVSLKKSEQFDDAFSAFKDFVAAYRDSVYRESALLECIDLAERVHDVAAALVYCSRFITEFPAAAGVEDVYMKKARFEYESGSFDLMHDTLVTLLQAYPETQKKREVLYNLGRYFERTEEYAEALLQYKNARAVEDKDSLIRDAELAVRLGVVYYFSTRYDEAEGEFMRVFNADEFARIPDDMLFWLGDYFGEKGAITEAIRVYTTFLQRDLSPELRERVMYKVADWHREHEAWQKAHALYTQFAKEFPQSELDIFVKLGRALCDEALGNIAAAKEAYALLVTSDVPYIKARSYQGLGNILYAEGDLEEAVRSYMFVTILFDDPIVPDLMLKSAEIWIELGRIPDARALLNDFKARFPGHLLTPRVDELLGAGEGGAALPLANAAEKES